jgi:hypothetical protein
MRKFFLLHSPGLQSRKSARKKTIGGKYIRGQDPVDHANQLCHQSCFLKKKNSQNDKKDHQLRHCCLRRHFKSPAVKLSMQLSSLRSRLSPSRFSSRKDPNCCPSTSFCKGTKIQSALPPQSMTFNGDKSVEKICQTSCSQNSATADFYPFQTGEVRAGRPLIDPGQPHK